MAQRTPRPAEIKAVAKILEHPVPDPSWRWKGACLDVPLSALPQDAENQGERTARANAFIGAYCGSCSVKTECIRDAFDSYTEAPDGVVLGGYTPGQAKILWHAARGLRSHDTVEAALEHYGRLEVESAQRAEARAAAKATAEAAAAIPQAPTEVVAVMPQSPAETSVVLPPASALAPAPPQAA